MAAQNKFPLDDMQIQATQAAIKDDYVVNIGEEKRFQGKNIVAYVTLTNNLTLPIPAMMDVTVLTKSSRRKGLIPSTASAIRTK